MLELRMMNLENFSSFTREVDGRRYGGCTNPIDVRLVMARLLRAGFALQKKVDPETKGTPSTQSQSPQR
jgi:hypothetical protein